MARFNTRKNKNDWKLTDMERRIRREAKRTVVPLDTDFIMATLAFGVDSLPNRSRVA